MCGGVTHVNGCVPHSVHAFRSLDGSICGHIEAPFHLPLIPMYVLLHVLVVVRWCFPPSFPPRCVCVCTHGHGWDGDAGTALTRGVLVRLQGEFMFGVVSEGDEGFEAAAAAEVLPGDAPLLPPHACVIACHDFPIHTDAPTTATAGAAAVPAQQPPYSSSSRSTTSPSMPRRLLVWRGVAFVPSFLLRAGGMPLVSDLMKCGRTVHMVRRADDEYFSVCDVRRGSVRCSAVRCVWAGRAVVVFAMPDSC